LQKQSIFVHRGWTRLSPPGEAESAGFQAVRDRCFLEIPVTAARQADFIMRLMIFICPFTFVTYAITLIASRCLAMSTLGFNKSDLCFNPDSDPKSTERMAPLLSALKMLSLSSAFLGFMLAVALPVQVLGLWRALGRYLVWWARRNWALSVLGGLRAILTFIVSENAEKPSGALGLLIVFLFGGLDFVLMLTETSMPRSSIAAWRRVCRVFYLLNICAITLDWMYSWVERSLCFVREESIGMYIGRTMRDVVRATFLLQLILLHIKKIRRVTSPATRYSTACSVYVQRDVQPGELASFLLGPSEMAIVAAITTERAAEDLSRFHFVYPPRSFQVTVQRWGYLLFLWCLVGFTEVVLSISRVSLSVTEAKKVCWQRKEDYSASLIIPLTVCSTVLIIGVILLMVRLLVKFRLGRVVRRWIRYWSFRNALFVAFCVIRGFNEFRPRSGLVEPWFTVIKYSLVLPVSLSVIDLVLILKPPATLKKMLWVMILFQVLTQIADNTRAQFYENPCQLKDKDQAGLTSKIQNTLLLLFSVQYLAKLYQKANEGLETPLLNFSDTGRFSTSPILPENRLLGQKISEEVHHQQV
jgi:hypothetical protein